jgi:hypothetical protein
VVKQRIDEQGGQGTESFAQEAIDSRLVESELQAKIVAKLFPGFK